MRETIYNYNHKQEGLPLSYCRKRVYQNRDPFVSMKHMQKTNRVSASHYTSAKGTMMVSSDKKEKAKHGSYERYLRKLKKPLLQSKGSRTGIVKGCKCGNENEITYGTLTAPLDPYPTPAPKSFINGQFVYAMKLNGSYYEKATLSIDGITQEHTVTFASDGSTETKSVDELETFFECPCGSVKKGKIYISSTSEEEKAKCLNFDDKKKSYFIQMGGYYKNICVK